MPDELPTGYYHTNFCTLLGFVQDRYHDLLTPGEQACIDEFHDLTLPAQRLFVRLLTRKGPLYRSDRLLYDEIPDTEATLDELSSAGFVVILRDDGANAQERISRSIDLPDQACNGGEEVLCDAILTILTRDELGLLTGAARNCRRPELLAQARELLLKDVVSSLPFRVVAAERLREIECFRLLFFGNSRQNLTDFVLRDLGIAPYETYTIDETSRFFSCRERVEEVRQAYEIADLGNRLLQEPEVNDLTTFARAIPGEGSSRAQRVYDRTRNELARQLERMQDLESALDIYQQSTRHPARERQVRILMAQDRLADALVLVNGMLAGPWNDDELEFARLSRHRIFRQLARPTDPPARCQPPQQDLVLVAEDDVRVEELVRHHFEQSGYEAYFVENVLFPGLFGLLFWDAIFSHQPGVFFNEFQRGPVDLFEPGFVHARRPLIDECFRSLSSGEHHHRIRSTFRHKFPVVNHFVHWGGLDDALLEISLARIPPDHMMAVFRRMLVDLRNNRSGFPDLIVFPPGSGYELIEVKGPGDTLQKHQRRWFGYFQQHNIPARVARVQYAS